MTDETIDVVDLRRAVDTVVGLSEDWSDLHDRSTRLAKRTTTGDFRIAAVGEFKRGKSTLLNAILGRAVLPTGVLPVTTVPIELASGSDHATVAFSDGRRTEIELDEIAHYTTEAENPENRLAVDHVEAFLRAPLLEAGLTLIDVPGMGSVHEGATEVAHRSYRYADGAILVLAADTPLSAEERRVAGDLRERGARLFVVVNKSDRLTLDDLEQVRRFVASALDVGVGDVYCTNALAALEGDGDETARGFQALLTALAVFVDRDLVRTRQLLLTRELQAIGAELAERATLERLAGQINLEDLEAKVALFKQAVEQEHERSAADGRAIATEVATLREQVRSRIVGDAAAAAAARSPELDERLPHSGSLLAAIRAIEPVVETIVREEFDRVWAEEALWLDREWARLAERHRAETEARLNAVRAVAAELFATTLPPVTVPSMERTVVANLYRFMPAISLVDDYLDPVRAIIPLRHVRRRVLRKAYASLAHELDKHVGRATAALGDRVSESWLAFERATREHLDAAVAGILDALSRASTMRDETESTLAIRRKRLDEIASSSAAVVGQS